MLQHMTIYPEERARCGICIVVPRCEEDVFLMVVGMLMEWTHQWSKLYVDNLQITVAFCLSEGDNIRFYPFFVFTRESWILLYPSSLSN